LFFANFLRLRRLATAVSHVFTEVDFF
jgi:hypothetical protein